MIDIKRYTVNARRTSINLLPYFIVSLLVTIYITDVIAQDSIERAVVASDLDYALRDALTKRDLERFNQSLIHGADPTEWFENSHNGWVYCSATEPGLEPYLQLIIDKGFDVNFRQTKIYRTAQLLLPCAVHFNNLLALEMLVSAGADPAVRMCLTCDGRAPMSAMAQAAMVGKYDLAVWLSDKGKYSYAQIQTVIYGLENFPVDESNPRNVPRLELVERIRSQGFEVKPWTRTKPKD